MADDVLLPYVRCPKCRKVFLLNHFTNTLHVVACLSAGIYDAYAECPHCHEATGLYDEPEREGPES